MMHTIRIRSICLTLVWLGLSAAALADDTASGTNLLRNPSFETLENGKPAGWSVYAQPPSGEAALEEADPADGHRSVMLCNHEALQPDPCNNWSQNVQGDFAGKRLRLKGCIRTQEVGGAALWVQCWQRAPLSVLLAATTADVNSMAGTHGWTNVDTTITVPKETRFLVVRCVLKGQGAAWFDNLSLTEEPEEEPAETPDSTTMKKETPQKNKKPLPVVSADEKKEEEAPSAPEKTPETSPPSQAPTMPPSDSPAQSPQELVNMLRDATALLKTYKAGNEALLNQVNALQGQIDQLKAELNKKSNGGTSTTVVLDSPHKSRHVPPLVPHGFKLEDLE